MSDAVRMRFRATLDFDSHIHGPTSLFGRGSIQKRLDVVQSRRCQLGHLADRRLSFLAGCILVPTESKPFQNTNFVRVIRDCTEYVYC